MNIRVRFSNSAWGAAPTPARSGMLMSQPVSWEASRTFTGRRPGDRQRGSCWSGTTTSDALWRILVVEHDLGDLGRRHRVDHEESRMSGDHWMMSIFSPCSSLTTACTREPRMPTQGAN